MYKRLKSEAAFMGPTHALSGLAVFLVLVALIPNFSENYLNSGSLWVIIIASLTTVGAALLPDIDNTSSTVKNSLGIIGSGMSSAFRAISLVFQSTIRTGRDDASPDPHRGFWHTIVAAILVGIGTWFLVNMGGDISVPLIGKITFGFLFAFLISFILIHLALAGLASSFIKKLKESNPIGELLVFLLSFGLTLVLFSRLPTDINFLWLALSITLGMIIHDLGDAVTTSGVPLLWPIPIKGKMWWDIRFSSIKAGGAVEKTIIFPILSIIVVVSIVIIAKNGTFT